MTNFDERFGAGGGFALGIKPPKKSSTFGDPGNLALSSTGVGKFEGSGRRAPIHNDVHNHLSLPVRQNANNTAFIARGENTGATSIWSNALSTYGAAADAFEMAYWYSSAANAIYHLAADNVSAVHRYRSLQKTDLAAGTITAIWTIPADVNVNPDGAWIHIFPVTPATPDTSNWVVVYSEELTPFKMIAKTIDSAGTVLSTVTLKADQGGSNQDVVFNGGYLTLAKDMLMSGIYVVSTGLASSGNLMFFIMRSSVRYLVVVPLDGIVPTASFDEVSPVGAMTTPIGTMVTPWDDSVILLSDNRAASADSFKTIFGARVFDRVDFDRWLNEIADFYSLPAAEVYF